MTAGLLVAVAWVLIGVAIVCVLLDRSDLVEVLAGVLAVVAWPAVLFAQVIQVGRRRRHEAERQARIGAKVAGGEYTHEQAERLGWNGATS